MLAIFHLFCFHLTSLFLANVFKLFQIIKARRNNKSSMKNYEIFHLIKSYKLTEYNFITSSFFQFFHNPHYSRFHRNALEWKTFIFCFPSVCSRVCEWWFVFLFFVGWLFCCIVVSKQIRAIGTTTLKQWAVNNEIIVIFLTNNGTFSTHPHILNKASRKK